MGNIPNMQPVKSSNVEAIGYHPGENELHVRFKGGGHYIYQGVAKALHDECLGCDSVGRFINQNVKGRFPHRIHDAKPDSN